MRTKTLLLAAAALAAGVLASQAQSNVYSANVVGYANVVVPAGNHFVMVANPLTTGNDVISNVITGAPGATQLQYWNGSGFTTFTFNGLAKSWKVGTVVSNTLPLPPGVGFFLSSSTAFTNTFVGSVLANNGTSVTNPLPTGLSAVGAQIPYSDTVTNGATVNLLVGGGSQLQQWSVGAQAFNTFTYNALGHTWKVGTTATNPVIGVAEGFFLSPSASTNWVEALNLH